MSPTLEVKDLSLATLAAGGAGEVFDDELERVIRNALDINTKQKAPRSVTLTITLKPTGPKRSKCSMEWAVTAKIAPPLTDTSEVSIGLVDGKAVARSSDLRQLDAFDARTGEITTPEDDPKVASITTKKERAR